MVICPRVESPLEYGDAGYVHIMGVTVSDKVIDMTKMPKPEKKKYLSSEQVREAAIKYGCKTEWPDPIYTPQCITEELNVSRDSLVALGCGEYAIGQLAFPMFDANGDYTGIRFRYQDGSKKSLKGGREGLFLPHDLPSNGTVYIVEGPTDTAAMLTMDLPAIGRPNCCGGTKHILEWAEQHPDVQFVIIADKDTPGKKGARRLAKALGDRVQYILVPQFHKDVRDYLSYFVHAKAAKAGIVNRTDTYWEQLSLEKITNGTGN